MEYREFGRTGLRVSAIGIGCWEIGGGYGAIEAAEFERAVNRALDLGINCFDTAEAYGFGASERALGKALGSRRDQAIVVTKFGVGYPDARNYRDSSPDRMAKSIEGSLRALGTDHVDVYLVHWPDVNTPFEVTLRSLDDLVGQGKTRFVGVSNFRPSQIEASMGTRRIDVAQYGLSLFDRRMGREILPLCRRHGIGVMAYGPLAYGLLTGTFTPEMKFDEGDWRARQGRLGNINLMRTILGPEYVPRNLAAVEELRRVARRHGKSLPQLALRWVTSNPAISVALMGCRRPEEVEENVGALDWAIPDEDLREIDAIFARHGIDPAPDTWIED
jgi:hypothetical protein